MQRRKCPNSILKMTEIPSFKKEKKRKERLNERGGCRHPQRWLAATLEMT
jgi:hypothetical protein